MATGLVLTLAMGCADAPSPDDSDEDGTRFLGPEEMEVEYWEATETLPLPEGAKWPPVANLYPEADEHGIVRGDPSYEVGHGVANAYRRWFCAWQREWLAQRGEDPEREAEALEMLLSYPDLERYEEFHAESSQRGNEELLSQARRGDPSGIARNVDLNCGSPPDASPAAVPTHS